MVIELDGVRHLLVEVDSETHGVCNICSLHDFCVDTPNCFCYIPGFENKKTRYVIENGNTD